MLVKIRFSALLVLIALIVVGCANPKGFSRPTDGKFTHRPTVEKTQHYRVLMSAFEEWRGVGYRYGGNDRAGIDCSGLVHQVYRDKFGVVLPRTTATQVKRGQPVAIGDMVAGDLIFFKTGVKDRHVGMYLGGRDFLHVSTKAGVKISSLDNVYWNPRIWQARRVLP